MFEIIGRVDNPIEPETPEGFNVAVKVKSPCASLVRVTWLPLGVKLAIPVGETDHVTVWPTGILEAVYVADVQKAIVVPVITGRLSTSDT